MMDGDDYDKYGSRLQTIHEEILLLGNSFRFECGSMTPEDEQALKCLLMACEAVGIAGYRLHVASQAALARDMPPAPDSTEWLRPTDN